MRDIDSRKVPSWSRVRALWTSIGRVDCQFDNDVDATIQKTRGQSCGDGSSDAGSGSMIFPLGSVTSTRVPRLPDGFRLPSSC